jgi:hypothetical protein
MARVTVTLAVQVKQVPAGTPVGDYHVEIQPKAGGEIVFLEQPEPSFFFEDVAAGEYVVRAWRVGVDEGIQPKVTQEFSVAAAPVDVLVPIGVSVSVQ